jgi:hypothetical protein
VCSVSPLMPSISMFLIDCVVCLQEVWFRQLHEGPVPVSRRRHEVPVQTVQRP